LDIAVDALTAVYKSTNGLFQLRVAVKLKFGFIVYLLLCGVFVPLFVGCCGSAKGCFFVVLGEGQK